MAFVGGLRRMLQVKGWLGSEGRDYLFKRVYNWKSKRELKTMCILSEDTSKTYIYMQEKKSY